MQVFEGSVYGEITDKGTEKLIGLFANYFNDRDGVFYDLGSGEGDLAIKVATSTSIGKVIGVELHKERYLKSESKLKQTKLDNVSFVNEDFLKTDLSNATVIYYANEGIPKNTSNKLWDNIPKGCLLICGRRVRALDNIKKYALTTVIEKSYTKKRGNWYIIKQTNNINNKFN